MGAAVQSPRAGGLPETIELGEFVLSISGLEETTAAAVAQRYCKRLRELTFSRSATLGYFYDLEIDEIEVWSGSRKSRHRARFKRRKGGFRKLLARAITALGLLSIDPSQIEENVQWALQQAQEIIRIEEQHDLRVEDIDLYGLRTREPSDDQADDDRARGQQRRSGN